MLRHLRTYLMIIAGLIGACIVGLWAVGAFDLSPRWRMGIVLLTAILISGTTRLFWMGRRSDD